MSGSGLCQTWKCAGNEAMLIFSFLSGTWTYLIRSTNNMLVEITSFPLQANCCIQPSGNTSNHDIDSLRLRAEFIICLIYVRFRQIPCKGRGQKKHLTSNMQAALHSRFMRFTGFHYGCWAPPLSPRDVPASPRVWQTCCIAASKSSRTGHRTGREAVITPLLFCWSAWQAHKANWNCRAFIFEWTLCHK